jgi:hypothetical protein
VSPAGASRPGRALADLAARRGPGVGLAAMLVLAGCYSGLCLLLWSGGHAPSRPGLLPVDAGDYYLAQAAALPLLFPALWLLYAALAHGLCRALGGRGTLRDALGVLGIAYALPVTAAYVLPDIAAYLLAGFDGLVVGMRYYGPAALLGALWLSAAGLSATHRLPTGRAAVAATVAFLLQAVAGGTILR